MPWYVTTGQVIFGLIYEQAANAELARPSSTSGDFTNSNAAASGRQKSGLIKRKHDDGKALHAIGDLGQYQLSTEGKSRHTMHPQNMVDFILLEYLVMLHSRCDH